MKISSLLLAGSVVANVAIVVIFVVGASGGSAPATITREVTPPTAPVANAAVEAAGLWSELRSDDLRDQVEKLRTDGFPPAMIRAIVAAQIRAKFASRRKTLEAAQGELPFWKTPTPDAATQAAFRALAKEEQQAIKDVLGPDPENGPAASLRRQFPGFSAETIEQMVAIRERYDQQRSELYGNLRGPGGLLPEEQAKIEALDKAQHAEIAAVLSPPDLEEYDLRTSNAANQLRYNLVAFNPTEQEFRALYKLQSAFDEQYRFRSMPSEELMRARSEAQKQLTEQIKTALGPERSNEYQRATDYNYRQTTQLVARLNLAPETANSLYTIQKEFEQRRNDMYRNSGRGGSLAFDRMAEQATALQQEAITRVMPVLGNAKNVDAYKQYGGSWITSMVPRPPPSRAAPPKS